jgi:hypothetical protein
MKFLISEILSLRGNNIYGDWQLNPGGIFFETFLAKQD